MEALQILKYQLKQDHLNFMEGLVLEEVDYTINGPLTANALQELEACGEAGVEELCDLLHNAEM